MKPYTSPMTIQNGKTYHVDFRPYINILKKRKWLVVLPSLILLPLITLKLLLQEPAYQSTASILIEPENPNIVGFQEIFKNGSYHDYYQTQYRLISGRSLLEKTIDKLSASGSPPNFSEALNKKNRLLEILEGLKTNIQKYIANHTSFIRGHVSEPDTILSSPEEIAQEQLIKDFREALTVKPIADTRLVDITISHPDAVQAARIVNILAETYVAQNLSHKVKTMEESSKWLTELVTDLKNSLQNSEKKLQDFVKEYGIAGAELQDVQSVALDGIRNLNVEYIEAKTRRLDLQTRLDELKDLQSQPISRSVSLSTKLSDSVIPMLFMKYAELNGERARIVKNFRPGHPMYIDIHAQIQQIERDITRTIRRQIQNLNSELRAVTAKESALRQELKSTETSGLGVNSEIVKYSILKGDAESKRELYQDIIRRLSEANITKGLKTNNISVVESGTVPVEPAPAWKGLKWSASLMLTLSIGMALAFLAELCDKRFRDVEEAERYLQLPFLGLIPHSRINQRQICEAVGQGSYQYDDWTHYRLLRTHVQFIMSQKAISSLLVTSAAPGEGKSTTVANLGFVFSTLDKKVLLVDADLYRPTLHTIFGLQSGLGLSDFLMQGGPYQNFIQQTKVPNLSVLTRGSLPTQPTELLSSSRMKELIQNLNAEYDTIIYDSPMVLSLPDTTILAPEVDGVLLVHDIKVANRETIASAKHTLEKVNTNLLGIIFNNVDLKKMKYYSYSYQHDIKNMKSQKLLAQSS